MQLGRNVSQIRQRALDGLELEHCVIDVAVKPREGISMVSKSMVSIITRSLSYY